MKRTISISLLFLMLLVAVHPTLIFHFCKGDLASVNMLDNQESSCCGNAHTIPSADNITSGDKCCNTTHAVFSTESYRYQNNIYELTAPAFERLAFICNFYMLHVSLAHITTSTKYKFPPDGLAEQNADLLAFISIYRI